MLGPKAFSSAGKDFMHTGEEVKEVDNPASDQGKGEAN